MAVVNSAIMKNLFLMPAVVVMSAAVHAAECAQIVTPFVRVRTYLTRNFATLGPL